jgi:hypothetical protein
VRGLQSAELVEHVGPLAWDLGAVTLFKLGRRQ